MSALSCRKCESAVESTESLSSEGAADRAGYTMSALPFRKIVALSRVRKGKVLAIRQQVDQGTYDPDERMDAVLDRLLADLTAQDSRLLEIV
ncbi:MAG: flagellar biosynthesis anti-sigma factor FlgM [Phycisphaerales bacterium]|nr:MAG: flagellar biosynthesis anti-sigma factor FlgM [Phycisphaerales bacterium]